MSFLMTGFWQQGIFKDIYTSEEPFLGLGPSLVLHGNSNHSLLNQRITLGIKGIHRNPLPETL